MTISSAPEQPRSTSFRDALNRGIVVLDGGLSTQLESTGHDVSSDLWSARLLRDDPAAVRAAHLAFFQAGARVATTASYQATFPGFAAAGIGSAEAAALMARSVTLARDAADACGLAAEAWVAGSVGPYGAMLADGSEYTGAYAASGWPDRSGGGLGVAELRRFHRPRMQVLADAGADVLACETVPALAEAEALVAELDELGVPGWLSLTTVTGPDGSVRTRRGEPADAAFAMARDVASVVAVGVNCIDPAGVATAVAEAAEVSGKPVVVYPNSGERWDAATRRWSGAGGLAPADIATWLDLGARLVGGCCRIGPATVREVAAAVSARG
jgi:homocysteine S-methyltransferase